MAGGSQDDVRAHIAKVTTRTHRDVQLLADALSDYSWPGGGDRSEPGALGWLARWRPSGPAPLGPRCGCADGRCLVCN
jgi:hypothetical protein